MLSLFDPLRDFSPLGVTFRLILALLSGAILGYGRTKRGSDAGLRTYMLISLGAALSVTIALYEFQMLSTVWSEAVQLSGSRFDASRMASLVLSGIGFLGAGTILKTSHQQAKGLTTATGLFIAACMSLAAGAGYYECVIAVLVLTVVVLNLMTPLEALLERKLGNITLDVRMNEPGTAAAVTAAIENEKARIYDMDLEAGSDPVTAIFTLRMDRKNASRTGMLMTVASVDGVTSVRELIP